MKQTLLDWFEINILGLPTDKKARREYFRFKKISPGKQYDISSTTHRHMVVKESSKTQYGKRSKKA